MKGGTLLKLLAGKAAVTGALAALNCSLALDDLPPTLLGRTHDWNWSVGRVRYTTLGEGPPLLLLHGPNATASSYEMRNVFEPLAERFSVYAPTCLGSARRNGGRWSTPASCTPTW